MAKRPKWIYARPGPPEELRELFEADAGQGISDFVVDRAFWLGDGPTCVIDSWITALEAIAPGRAESFFWQPAASFLPSL